MARDNNVTIVGNLGRDLELKTTKKGTSSLFFSVAVAQPIYGDGSDEPEERTHWLAVQAFGTLAENAAESVGKGSRVIVSGHLESYEKEVVDENDDEVVLTMTKIVADSIAPDLRWATAEVEKNEKKPKRAKLDDEDEDKPARKSRSRRSRDDEDDDDFDEKPARRGSGRGRGRAADEEDED
ncbi:MAG: single-stranded DNA-binding protein, partial [Aeromicrobium sp.]|uniref:single-stranded DNA-binding protein n=1 Tax=Aeromicrobium sp. TaxID=1871063 RepID=UPI0039E4C2CE